MRPKAVKIPKIAVLRKAIKDIEENCLFYQKSTDFNGVVVKNVRVNKNFETIEEYKVLYDAKVNWVGRKEEFYDCWILLKDIMSFLKIPLS